jgi:hypothetical protein
VIGAETAAFLQSGCALVVGTVAVDGEPRASRGWGLTLLPGDGPEQLVVRLLLDGTDPLVRDNLAATGAIAVTAGNVRTLRSTQLKGRIVSFDDASATDLERAGRYVDAFVSDIVAVDRTPRQLIERMVPASFVGCTIAVTELYDQSPGPGAGARLEERAS